MGYFVTFYNGRDKDGKIWEELTDTCHSKYCLNFFWSNLLKNLKAKNKLQPLLKCEVNLIPFALKEKWPMKLFENPRRWLS